MLRSLGSAGFGTQVFGWAVIASIVVLVPRSVVAGCQFPMLIGLLGQGRDSMARQTGITYAANTLGAIIGSLAGGFGCSAAGRTDVWTASLGYVGRSQRQTSATSSSSIRNTTRSALASSSGR